MAETTGIEWTEATWNPIVGCSVVSPGCTNCYAMTMAARLDAMATLPQYAGTTRRTKAGPVWTGKLALAPEATLLAPLRRRKPTTWFVNSMGDLFHEDVPDAWIDRVFAIIVLCKATGRDHIFQILTKRADRMRAYFAVGMDVLRERWAAACWEMQITVGDGERIPDLLATPASIRFVSAEPLLGPIDFTLQDRDGWYHDTLTGHSYNDAVVGGGAQKLDWIIVGGESGKGARPMHPDWARGIRDQCAAAGTAFFFKQWGEWAPGTGFEDGGRPAVHWNVNAERFIDGLGRSQDRLVHLGKSRAGRILDGVEHNGMPELRHG